MTAQNVPLYIEQGATFRTGFFYRQRNFDGTPGDPVDLTGYSAVMQLRRTVRSETVAMELSTEGDDIWLSQDGQILMQANAEATSALTARQYVYDLELTAPNGDIYRVAEGKVKVSLNVTRFDDEDGGGLD